MDYQYLPERIQRELEQLVPQDKTPIAVLRSSGGLDGQSGEGYVIAYPEQMLMFSKAFGELEFSRFAAYNDNDLSELYLVNGKYHSFLHMKLADREYTIKLSSFETKDCEPIIAKWKEICAGKNRPVPPPLPPEAIPAEPQEQTADFNPMI